MKMKIVERKILFLIRNFFLVFLFLFYYPVFILLIKGLIIVKKIKGDFCLIHSITLLSTYYPH